MIHEIMKDPIFLSMRSEEAFRPDAAVGDDLLDTLRANSASCVGMAANMIGIRKNVIAVLDGSNYLLMFNAVIVGHTGLPYETEEGCLSLPGVRKATRYEKITVEYHDRRFKRHKATFSGRTAQIIQHEIDHTNGILI